MKFLSIATAALLVVISASLHITDEFGIFQDGARLPDLNSKFGMSCQSNTLYNVRQIERFARMAYKGIQNGGSGVESCTFAPFPNEVFYAYYIGKSYAQATGYAENYIIINFVGHFYAGFYQYQSGGETVSKLCQFDWDTQFHSIGYN